MPLVLYTPPELSQRLAARIRDLRLEQGLSQQQLAERAGVAVPTYRHFEQSGQISLERLASVVTVLGRADDFDSLLAPRASGGSRLTAEGSTDSVDWQGAINGGGTADGPRLPRRACTARARAGDQTHAPFPAPRQSWRVT